MLSKHALESFAMVEATYQFWFSDQDQFRSPFSPEIREKLKRDSFDAFYSWSLKLDSKGKEEMSEEFFRDKLEELIFQTGLKLVKTEDEKLTIYYPFLMRPGDLVYPKDGQNTDTSIVISRKIQVEGDKKFFEIILENQNTKQNWKSKFELPA
ncbi:hypothetical protein [Algoriphagus persicinus]|uniref:hypothetical protein n=1 Tax=Algoriphagus persicinus TaxID=3108754 RepID=UPI002B3AB73C|nr:hypothetical protein [Algoriphagus sp. E1-3-M2]MEB2785329.1 hypothetical protein [Algoriphagus sp. E1-3-M2]